MLITALVDYVLVRLFMISPFNYFGAGMTILLNAFVSHMNVTWMSRGVSSLGGAVLLTQL